MPHLKPMESVVGLGKVGPHARASGKRQGRGTESSGGRSRGSTDPHGSHFAQGRIVGFRHPVAHLIGVRRKFEFDRGRARKTCVSNGGKILSEWRIASPRRQIAMIEPVAIGDVHLSYPAHEPSERAWGNSH